MKNMTPKEKGQFLIDNFKDDHGNISLSDVDLSDFKGNVVINGWKVGGHLFQNYQEVGGSLFQDFQQVGCTLHQDFQQVGGILHQDEQKAKDGCKCVEPDYKAEYERLSKELCEANRKIETLMWSLGKIKEAGK